MIIVVRKINFTKINAIKYLSKTKKKFDLILFKQSIHFFKLMEIKKILNSKNQLISSNLQKDSSPEKRRPNMKRSLGYSRIKHNFEKGLKETVLWYKGYYIK